MVSRSHESGLLRKMNEVIILLDRSEGGSGYLQRREIWIGKRADRELGRDYGL